MTLSLSIMAGTKRLIMDENNCNIYNSTKLSAPPPSLSVISHYINFILNPGYRIQIIFPACTNVCTYKS